MATLRGHIEAARATENDRRAKSKQVRSVDVRRADNGGYVAETRHEGYDIPTKTTIHQNHKSLAAHIAKVMPC